MKKIKFCLLAVALMTVCVSAHAVGIQEYYAKNEPLTKDFSDNVGKQWLLTNVTIDGKDTGFNRSELSGMVNGNDFFTLNFSNVANRDTGGTVLIFDGIISGVGAPNRFSGPFTDKMHTVEIMPLRSTLMASLFELDSLKEYDYFNYLQNAYKFRRVENGLEIFSRTEDKEVVLSFVENE